MVKVQEECLFAPSKVAWLLSEGAQELDAGERQMLLVMAETRLQEGYKPTSDEKKVIDWLRASAGDDYDARDIRRKVRTMVKGRTKPDSSPMRLPPMFDRLLKRFRTKPDPDGGAG